MQEKRNQETTKVQTPRGCRVATDSQPFPLQVSKCPSLAIDWLALLLCAYWLALLTHQTLLFLLISTALVLSVVCPQVIFRVAISIYHPLCSVPNQVRCPLRRPCTRPPSSSSSPSPSPTWSPLPTTKNVSHHFYKIAATPDDPRHECFGPPWQVRRREVLTPPQ